MQWMEFITVGLLLCTGGPAVGAGGESPALYVTEGDDVTLPCKNVLYPNCSSTTWVYSNRANNNTDELVAHGKIKDPQKHGRLSLLTDCSLHINNVSAEDAGLYTCQQYEYENGPKYGDDTAAFLSVLTVRKSQSGGTVTLHCLLYTYYGPGQCDHVPFNTVTLRWVSDTDPPRQRDPSSQTHTGRCNSTLLINHPRTEKDQRKWRCQLLDKGEVKLTSRPGATPPGGRPGGTATGAGLLSGIGAAAAVFGAVCLAAVVMVTYRRRAGGSSPPCMSENDMASNPKTTEDEVTYSMVNHPAPKKRERANSDDFTEYATVRTGA